MLLEVLLGFLLFAMVVVAAGSGTVVSTVTTSSAQQRDVASTLVSGVIAQAEGLPYADLEAGLNPTTDQLSNDPNIEKVGSTYELKLTGATLAVSNTNTSEAPLVPHTSTTTLGIPYKVASYPSVSSTGIVTLVVIVSWISSLGGQSSSLVGETEIASP